MSSPRYFVYPFAGGSGANLSPIDTSGTGVNTGFISYQYGFTPNYSLDLNTDSSAIPISRPQFNQLMNDITLNIQQYWQYGNPFPITTADNLGTDVTYPIYSRIYYDSMNGDGPQIWENQTVGNINLPNSGNNEGWNVVSGAAVGNPPGTIIDFANVNAPVGYLVCNGQTPLRSDYPELLAAITISVTATLDETTTISGLSNYNGLYVGMPVEAADIPTGTTISSIPSSFTGSITISQAATASASETITFFPWLNGDGSTTFTIPNLISNTTAGQGGNLIATTPYTDQVGQAGGSSTATLVANNLPPHDHSYSVLQNNGASVLGGSGWSQSAPSTTGLGPGTSTPFSIVQQTTIMNKCIKY